VVSKNKKRKRKEIMSVKRVAILVGAGVALITLFSTVGSLVETNYAGNYQIKQASLSGDLSSRQTPGVYYQGMGEITTYPVTYTLYFSEKDGGDGAHETGCVEVRFNDAGTAKVCGQLQLRFPTTEAHQLALHRDYKHFDNVATNMIRPLLKGALMSSAALLRAEESYSSRRAEFAQLVEEQIRLGLFETVAEEARTQDVEGNDFIERTVKVKRHKETGLPVVQRPSPLSTYGMDVVTFTIAEIDFDNTVDALITKKKEAEQQRVVARANAERAKQDAITAEEQGKAQIAVAKATKEVEKIEAVTAAQKEAEVAKWNRERDSQVAQAALVTARAEAEGNKLKVAAGLTPLERAQLDNARAIGVAAELAKLTPPSVMVFGGDKGSPMNPLEAMGIDAYLNVSDRLQKSKQ